MSEKSSRADWRDVGDSFKDLGRKLKEHAGDAQNAIKESSAPLSGVATQVGAVFKTGLAKFDETVTDPAVGAAARGVAGKFLDALKSQLGADQPTPSTEKRATPNESAGPNKSAGPNESAGPGDEQPEGPDRDPKAPAGT